ncbi:protocatechuate 3,4-dioxygenase subunit alpha [Thalassococcus sp. CAU 1522]|uniref:Protocatechuate 3,4-dioxygenase subunit alpha n=1 Tax=Thalassococcus arenae TaxID=2851652 RepID=A0ABS6N4E8_9RHOB|nr:protocatechuate 3,4-dioxygenase subunit alpha [Thalassococcus arenae]MBV2358532.1 protocatechuate 3,4-dioxygenase subunit alpha [Thalassococcus arenae]
MPRRPYQESPSQTAGPYVHIGCMPNLCGIGGIYPHDLGHRMCGPKARGTPITVTGRVIDGSGALLHDALVEAWQADAAGRYPGNPGSDPDVTGFGRAAADDDSGDWRFETIKPGAVPCGDGQVMAPHLTLWIVARGINLGLHTRMYFPEDTGFHAADPWLTRIEPHDRVSTLIAERTGDGVYQFDIHLQGALETVFFDV